MSLTSRDWALDLWDHGFQPIITPLKSKSPNLAWKKWQTERVPRAQVEDWFALGEHNIAIITGSLTGVVVVDGDSAEACEYIEATCGPSPMKVLSSKGAHFYYSHPGGKVRNSVRVVDDPPIDIRGDGGMIIGPGSIHPSGNAYRMAEGADIVATSELPLFRREWFPALETANIVEFKKPMMRFSPPVHQDAYDQAERYINAVPGAVQGNGGDQTTYILACRLVRGFSLSDEEALQLLLRWNAGCTPPWSEANLAAKVKHGRAYGTGDFGSQLMRGDQIRAGVLCVGWPN